MNILDEIVAHKKEEVAARKTAVPIKELERSSLFSRTAFSMRQYLINPERTGIIAEFKRKSPSKGVFNAEARPEIVTKAYADGGASGLSVLTDEKYFAGSNEDLKKAREINDIPILRKDFIIDEYQVLEAKAIGADVILLIAECLSAARVKQLAALAKELGMETLLEVHSGEHLEKISPDILLLGVNNRDLTTFTVSVQRSLDLVKKIPAHLVKVAESGISKPETIFELRQAGFSGFLVGEHFMKEKDPGLAFREFAGKLKNREAIR